MFKYFSIISVMILTILTVFLVVLPLVLPPLPPPPLVLLFVPVLIMAVLVLVAFSPLPRVPGQMAVVSVLIWVLMKQLSSTFRLSGGLSKLPHYSLFLFLFFVINIYWREIGTSFFSFSFFSVFGCGFCTCELQSMKISWMIMLLTLASLCFSL